MSTETYHVLNCMADIHTKNKKKAQCVPHCLKLIQLKNYSQGSILCY